MTVAIEMGNTKAGALAAMDLEELLATRLLVQGNSGSGKSHLLRRLLEQSAPWVQQTIIDPEGDFVSLAECFGHLVIDAHDHTILLRRPLTLDLGAVAKGLAVDAAARELQPFRNFAIDAGGDLYLSGCNPQGKPWSAGIRHPRVPGHLVDSFRISDRAVCTSGDYERGQHILDPRCAEAAHGVASATVVAPSAMLADALATAAFVLDPKESIPLLTRMGVEGLIVTAGLELLRTPGLCRA